MLYDLPGPELADGWLMGSIMEDEPASIARFESVRKRFAGLPIASTRRLREGIPHVYLDNYQGMRKAVLHLIEEHGHRRIAFLRGPEAHPYARERYQAYIDVLTEHGLPLDPNLVTPPRNWNQPAFHVLINERKLLPPTDFDAVVTANDLMAFDVLKLAQAKGIRVPKDMALVGFNDYIEGRIAVPSLTSVALPFYEQGQKAFELIYDLIQGHAVPERIELPAELHVRQSCGCLSEIMVRAAATESIGRIGSGGKRGTKSAFKAGRSKFISEAAQALGQGERRGAEWAARLWESIESDVRGRTSKTFLPELDEMVGAAYLGDADITSWHHIVSALRTWYTPNLDGDARAWAEDLCHQARVMIGELTLRSQMRSAWRSAEQARTLREIARELITTFEMEKLMDVLVAGLPRLGIESCFLSLYEDPNEPAAWSRLILAYDEHGRKELPPGGRRFASSLLVPEGMLPKGRRYDYVVEALFFQDNKFGFVLFEAGTQGGEIYKVLRDQIASALQGSMLVQRVRERSAELVRQHYILDTFMENVPDRIYFKDLDSRITRANKSHAKLLGLSDPADEIGKSDFDFFPEELARVKREQEREIIRTGRPLLDIEEPDAKGRWALSTKMPLRDENGRIVGVFGISRDITGIKQAQVELEKAYGEVENQVRERTSQLRREIDERIQAEKEVQRLNTELEKRVMERTTELEAANRELEAFSYSVSHDLRTPIRAIDGFAGILLEEFSAKLPPEAIRHLNTIHENSLQMGRLIDDLLAFLSLSRPPLNLQTIDTGRLVREALESLHKEQEGRAVQISVGELPVCKGDPLLLKQVWINLLSNSLKFTRERKTAKIQIGCITTPDGEKVFSVKDNGVGFSMEHAGKLFGVFQRLHRIDEYEGTGVGLAIVKRIIVRHGGRVWTEARAGEGATFYFTL
jgi:PAS domain S-box-containing protein